MACYGHRYFFHGRPDLRLCYRPRGGVVVMPQDSCEIIGHVWRECAKEITVKTSDSLSRCVVCGDFRTTYEPVNATESGRVTIVNRGTYDNNATGGW